MQRILIEQSAYLDSISLMRLSKKVRELPGVTGAMVAMATDTNIRLLEESGFDISGLGATCADKMMIAVEADAAAEIEAALAVAKQELAGKARRAQAESGGGGGPRDGFVAKGLDGALKFNPDIDLVLISTPGRFAAYEAFKALRAGKHVMIFSDNVPLEDEVRLKTLAETKGLLVMGPDCGTAIIGGAGLGFANKVPRGRIGIVAASGTGAQEVSTILARGGLGVSAIIGTGGRDVSDAVGGVMTRMGLHALICSETTDLIVIISKLPASRVVAPIIEAAKSGGKPCIIYFAGYSGKDRDGNLTFTRTLTETAAVAARLAGGRDVALAPPERERKQLLAQLGTRLPRGAKFVRGLFSGGTFAQEAVFILAEALAPLYVNMKLPATTLLDDPAISRGHTIVDLGDDAFTRGRAHPMIDQSYRLARLAREAEDPETAVVLLDVVLGYGCNDDPAGEIAAAIGKLGGLRGLKGSPLVVASVCGTAEDPQNYDLERGKLEGAGVVVAETNAMACELVRDIIRDL